MLLAVTLGVAAWTDLRTRLIRDWLTYPAAMIGVALQLARGGLGTWRTPGLESALAGCGIALVIFGIMWATGGMGAGDLKLAGAIGAIVGYPLVVGALVAGSLAGGVQGLFALAARTPPGRQLCAKLGMSGTEKPEFARKIPLGLGLAAGTAAFWVWWRAS